MNLDTDCIKGKKQRTLKLMCQRGQLSEFSKSRATIDFLSLYCVEMTKGVFYFKRSLDVLLSEIKKKK